ncbi:hypothetical protein [Kitasatospora sp. NPDC050543]|uniref:hypothetical protein n=1 Tax=Kitasatospora sp. NPDC050543 TaxID=3364054 RepID=UPI00378EEF2A
MPGPSFTSMLLSGACSRRSCSAVAMRNWNSYATTAQVLSTSRVSLYGSAPVLALAALSAALGAPLPDRLRQPAEPISTQSGDVATHTRSAVNTPPGPGHALPAAFRNTFGPWGARASEVQLRHA